MSDILSFFGIYPDEIERVDEICQDTLEHLGASDEEIDNVYDEARGDFFNADRLQIPCLKQVNQYIL